MTLSEQPARSFIDWDFARATARRLAPPGPKISAQEARAAVDELRAAAARAHGPVAETARLHTPPDTPDALVVDRPTWVDVNISSFSGLMDPVVAKLLERPGRPMPQAMRFVGGKATGTEVGTLLSFLSTKVLGQYDIAPGRPAQYARLLLVAPNVVEVERELGLNPSDFRLWVCLHEETHRVQFTANPWLRDHMAQASRSVLSELAPDMDTLTERLRMIATQLPEAMRRGGTGLLGLIATPEQQRHIAEVTAFMALLEGHADVVMDDVGPAIVPSVETIRAKFDRRREGMGPVDIIIRRLLGLEAKMAQYRDGAAFVRGVTSKVGVDGFNAVWTSPQTLPTPEEISDPARWVARVHG
ncbi:zinc-dependent metalloprotease [Gephyromycinifex aptenodytis]|uniref:zinc-dependent metalloprotease n=1 Tax=Gephyromycinifex aptenodytis TaxID=2716227 RepID=UPI001B2FEB45|nr:zinc-dependent metalloprotease [Gephyromycinifex aptenodytis]